MYSLAFSILRNLGLKIVVELIVKVAATIVVSSVAKAVSTFEWDCLAGLLTGPRDAISKVFDLSK